MLRKKILLGVCVLAVFGVITNAQAQGELKMRIWSPDFQDNQMIPQRLSCDGEGISPTLMIEDLPQAAKSLALIVDDPDAPMGTYVHWVVFDIPATSRIEENSVPGKLGINTSGRKKYVSPCPPSGTHRYYFKLYALDSMLNLKEGITKAALEKAMQGHILEEAKIIGLCNRGR